MPQQNNLAMKIHILLVISIVIPCLTFSQDLNKLQHLGHIVDMDEQQKDGIIETNLDYPWLTQKEIKFYSEDLIDGQKVRNKDKLKLGQRILKDFSSAIGYMNQGSIPIYPNWVQRACQHGTSWRW